MRKVNKGYVTAVSHVHVPVEELPKGYSVQNVLSEGSKEYDGTLLCMVDPASGMVISAAHGACIERDQLSPELQQEVTQIIHASKQQGDS